MSHNIYNNKFLTHRAPAWHGLGLVLDVPIDAVQAGQRLGLPYVYTVSLCTVDGLSVDGYKAIIGKDGDQTSVVYSVVSDDYCEITHTEFAAAFHRATGGAGIETIGLLGRGDTLFVTTKLPKFDVRGDEMDNYLLAYNPLTGNQAVTGRVTPVRVVCQNTLNASGLQYKEQFRVTHIGSSIQQIEAWLEHVWHTAQTKTETLKEAYNILAGFYPKDETVNDVLATVYDLPALQENPTEAQKFDHDVVTLRQKAHWRNVYNLYAGDGVGSSSEAARGTAWGVYNAVVEYEDHEKKHRRSSSAVFGPGADRKGVAFSELLRIAA